VQEKRKSGVKDALAGFYEKDSSIEKYKPQRLVKKCQLITLSQ